MTRQFVTTQVCSFGKERPNPDQLCLINCYPWVDLNEYVTFVGTFEHERWKVLQWIKTPATTINLHDNYQPTMRDTFVILENVFIGDPADYDPSKVTQPVCVEECKERDILKRLEELEKKVKDIPQQPVAPYPVYPPYQPYVPAEPVPVYPPQIWYHTVTPAGPGYYKEFQTISSTQKG